MAEETMVPKELNLSRRFEERLLRQAFQGDRHVPSLILTGFLGSGKTTVVNHIMRTRGNLRIAVLVNEVGDLDVDSLLVNAGQNNATIGIPSAPLAGGCACCQLQDDLHASLRQISGHGQQFDYLVLETSGAADPEPMADVLLEHGFHLDAVVTVVDAEAAHIGLDLATGRAQLGAADLIIINKCDLVGLAAMADLEDKVAEVVPNVRIVRTRFGQAPLESIMDVQEVSTSASHLHLQGQTGVLSHDKLPDFQRKWQVGGGAAEPSEASRKKARISVKDNGPPDQHREAQTVQKATHSHHSNHQGHEDHRGHSHSQEVVSVSVNIAAHLSLKSFHRFVTEHLMKSRGVYRAKGMVWISERRNSRAVMHFHGLHRFELHVLGPWEAPPCTQLVFIGKDADELRGLKGALVGSLAIAAAPPGRAVSPEGALETAVAAELSRLIAEHPRFEVVGPATCEGIVGFSIIGIPLKAIDAGVVNSGVMRAVNKGGKHVLLAGEVGLSAVFQGLGNQQKSRVSTLLLAVGAGESVQGEDVPLAAVVAEARRRATALWTEVLDGGRSVLTSAFQHAGGCSCDIGDAYRALADVRERAQPGS